MNDPLNGIFSQLINIAKSGGDPRNMLYQLVGNDPRIALAERMLRGKNASQMQKMAQNMAKEKGLSLDEIIQQLGL